MLKINAMRILKYLLVLVAVVLIAAFGFYQYVKTTRTPSYEGTIQLKGLSQEVEVYYTAHGIPHIYAKNPEDAYYAFGYVHAQDRLWQMDLLRHVGSGRLSELFGEELIATDKFIRTVGIPSYAKKSAREYQQRNHESLPLVQAYLNGINAFIDSNPRPLEHLILGLDVEPFTLQNVFETITYMAFSFQNAQKTDPVLTELANKLGTQYLDDLAVYHYPDETVIRNHDSRTSQLALQVNHVLQQMGVPEFIGSNSWVLAGEKTETGEVILANDPHIGFSQPSIWYEAHLTFPDKEYYGYHMSGIPFPLILHNESYANGLTMFENDDMDFYVEELHPEDSSKYKFKENWKSIESITDTIKVKGEDPVIFQIRNTHHGPIVSDILMENPLKETVSMYWVTSNHPNYTIELLHKFNDAKKMEDIEIAASMIHGPGLNVMYGDSSGNIAWWASGKLIKRADEQTSKTFYDGASGRFEPDSSYAFASNPHAINPPWGYVYSANNQPDTVDGVVYSGYYLPDDRAERITELLERQEKFSVEDVKDMTADTKSKTFEAIKGILLHAIKDTDDPKLVLALTKWNCTFDKEDYRPVIFDRWLYEILEGAMKDEMGDTLWRAYQGTHTYKVAIEHLVTNKDAIWWDNTTTEETETRSEVIVQAFERAISALKSEWGDHPTDWKWGEVHKLTHSHALGTVLEFLNVGEFPASGGNEVINNMGYTYSDEQQPPILFGPSTRRIIDFSDVRNNSWSILPTGQSGNYFSPYYEDQAHMFVNGEFRKMEMNHEVIKQSRQKLILHSIQ
ncbi:MAG: penicillin acylase family protein [Ekhidna sp.]